jgi:hypothetical protein
MELLASGHRIGYLLKSRVTDVAHFIETVERIAQGGAVVDPALVQELVAARRKDDPLEALTQREREVLALMAEGRSNAGIGRRLSSRGSLGLARDVLRHRGGHEPKLETRSARVADEDHVAIHTTGQLPRDRQPESESALSAGLRPAPEALEDLLALGLRHARPAIVHHDRARLGVRGQLDHDRRARRGEAQRVVEQDPHDLRHPVRVRHCPDGVACLQLDRSIALRRADRELRDHGSACLAQLDELAARRDAGVEAAEVEQLGGQPADPAGDGARMVELVGDRCGVEAAGGHLLAQQGERKLQRRQRRSQLV